MADDYFPGPSTGNPAGYIAGSINDGLSATEALDAYRDAGGAIRTQTWYRLYGEVTDGIARSPAASALDPYSLPNAGDYGTWTMGRGGQYATQVRVSFVDRGSGVVGSTNYTYVTDDPHTPAEAEAAAYDEYSDPDNASEYEQTVLGTQTTNVFQTVALGA